MPRPHPEHAKAEEPSWLGVGEEAEVVEEVEEPSLVWEEEVAAEAEVGEQP